MNLPTKTIDLGDGDYAIVVVPLLQRTRRQIQKYYQGLVKNAPQVVKLSELGKAVLQPTEPEIDLADIDQDEVAKVFIDNQVVELAIAGAVSSSPIDIGSMPDSKYKVLTKELDELYKPRPFPEPTESGSSKTPLSHS